MTVTDLEQRWKSLVNTGNALYRSLLISADCIPALYISLDVKGQRFMILQVPAGVRVECQSFEMENLSIEWHEEKRFILIGLRNNRFEDLYNDLALSLYNRIKDVTDPLQYTDEFIQSFHKWAEFFDDTFSGRLSEVEVKGVFGELIVLRYYISITDAININDILNAWQGPYDRAHDFNFSALNVEVKTKDNDQVSVRISSEFQLQPETGKAMQLAVVDVVRDEEGINLNAIIPEVKEMLIRKGADIAVFIKSLVKAGLNGNNVTQYNDLKWRPLLICFYDCSTSADFPKIISSEIPGSINSVKYNLTVSALQNFLIQSIDL
jgi:hypothetical protein